MSLDRNSLKLSDHQCARGERTEHGDKRSSQYAVPPANEADNVVKTASAQFNEAVKRSEGNEEGRDDADSEDDEYQSAPQSQHGGLDFDMPWGSVKKNATPDFMDFLQLELLKKMRPKAEPEGEDDDLPVSNLPVPRRETEL